MLVVVVKNRWVKAAKMSVVEVVENRRFEAAIMSVEKRLVEATAQMLVVEVVNRPKESSGGSDGSAKYEKKSYGTDYGK